MIVLSMTLIVLTELLNLKLINQNEPGHEKPAVSIYEQQRCKSACAFAQSDQHLCCSPPNSIIPFSAKSKISRLYLAFVSEQAGLSLTWS